MVAKTHCRTALRLSLIQARNLDDLNISPHPFAQKQPILFIVDCDHPAMLHPYQRIRAPMATYECRLWPPLHWWRQGLCRPAYGNWANPMRGKAAVFNPTVARLAESCRVGYSVTK